MSSNIRIDKICQHCGEEFVAKTTVTKYCGDVCAKRAYKARKRKEKIQAAKAQTIKDKHPELENLQQKGVSYREGSSQSIRLLHPVGLLPGRNGWNQIHQPG